MVYSAYNSKYTARVMVELNHKSNNVDLYISIFLSDSNFQLRFLFLFLFCGVGVSMGARRFGIQGAKYRDYANGFACKVLEQNGDDRVVCVVPARSSSSKCFPNHSSLPWVSEIDLVSAVLSGYLDPSLITTPPVLITSSCSTDETVVADSDAETESMKSDHIAAAVCSIEAPEYDSKATTSAHKLESVENYNEDKCSVQIVIPGDKGSKRDTSPSSTKPVEHDATTHDPESGYIGRLGVKTDNTVAKKDITDQPENGKLDIIYSQDLIVRDSIMSLPVSSTNCGVTNFKRFRKTSAPSPNSFEIFIPFAKYPYQESEYNNEDVAESIKEEKKRKQMETIAEDLFNSEKGRRRGAVGSLHGLFARK